MGVPLAMSPTRCLMTIMWSEGPVTFAELPNVYDVAIQYNGFGVNGFKVLQ